MKIGGAAVGWDYENSSGPKQSDRRRKETSTFIWTHASIHDYSAEIWQQANAQQRTDAAFSHLLNLVSWSGNSYRSDALQWYPGIQQFWKTTVSLEPFSRFQSLTVTGPKSSTWSPTIVLGFFSRCSLPWCCHSSWWCSHSTLRTHGHAVLRTPLRRHHMWRPKMSWMRSRNWAECCRSHLNV